MLELRITLDIKAVFSTLTQKSHSKHIDSLSNVLKKWQRVSLFYTYILNSQKISKKMPLDK